MKKSGEFVRVVDFIGETSHRDSMTGRKCGKRRTTEAAEMFKDAKTRMVMRINGVSRAKALEIIALRSGGAKAPDGGDCTVGHSCDDDDMMSAGEFFRD